MYCVSWIMIGFNQCAGCLQHCAQTAELGSEAEDGEETGETGAENSRSDPYPYSFVTSVCWLFFSLNPRMSGQRLAAEKGASDDILGAMNASERANAEPLSDEEEDA